MVAASTQIEYDSRNFELKQFQNSFLRVMVSNHLEQTKGNDFSTKEDEGLLKFLTPKQENYQVKKVKKSTKSTDTEY